MSLHRDKQDDLYRIFGVGLNKTGTTTLRRCFNILGLGPVAPGGSRETKKCTRYILKYHNYNLALRVAAKYRCFEDRPWNLWEMYKKADQGFPGSKFILTVRESEKWWRSVERWLIFSKPRILNKYCHQFNIKNIPSIEAKSMEIQQLSSQHENEPETEMMKKIISPLKEQMIAEYEKYNRMVIDYFSGRDNLFIVNFEKSCGWQPLCHFLSQPIPTVSLTHENRQYYDERDLKVS